MLVIILDAGIGKRLFPLTKETPKCLLSIGQDTILKHQLKNIDRCNESLIKGGKVEWIVDEVIVIVGFQAEKVENALQEETIYDFKITTIYDPFYDVYDNLESLWLAKQKMVDSFITIDGDNLFDHNILVKLIQTPYGVCIPSIIKDVYDEDDMKIQTIEERIIRIGKEIPLEEADADTVGMIKVSSGFARVFGNIIDNLIRDRVNLHVNYWKVVKELINGEIPVYHIDVSDLFWMELDSKSDLNVARRSMR